MASLMLSFPDDRLLAAQVAGLIQARVGAFAWRHFPDGESLVAIDENVAGADVVLFASLNDPDSKALPLRFAARTVRELGARRIGLVAPYLGYMRQDMRFHVGETISAKVFAQFLGESVDWLVTVDPHLHRIAKLDDVMGIPCTAVAAAPLLADWIRRNVDKPILLGPDSESAQWLARVADLLHAPYDVLRKVRRGDREVEVSLPDAERLRGHTPVLVDDIVSTGRTLVAAIEHLRRLQLPPAACVVIHAVFASGAWDALLQAGAARIVSTNSIAHHSNAISMAEPIAAAVAAHLVET